MTRRFCTEQVDGQPCGAIFDGPTQRCPPHQQAADTREQARRGTTTQRGYGTTHQQLRARLIAQWTPGQPCAIGGEPLTGPPHLLDLAHDHVNGGYLGLACQLHNRGEPGLR